MIPDALMAHKSVSNPYPNIDAASGSLLMHYGLTQSDFYTVMFGVSRAFGIMSALVWSKAFNQKIERPNSITVEGLAEKIKKVKEHHGK